MFHLTLLIYWVCSPKRNRGRIPHFLCILFDVALCYGQHFWGRFPSMLLGKAIKVRKEFIVMFPLCGVLVEVFCSLTKEFEFDLSTSR